MVAVNETLAADGSTLGSRPYGNSWICAIEGSDLDAELPGLKIGKSAVAQFQEDIDRFREFVQKTDHKEIDDPASLCIGAFEHLDDKRWESGVKEFFER